MAKPGSTEWKRTSWIGIVAGTVVGALVALAGSDGSTELGSFPVFALCAFAAFAINWLAFIPANAAKTEHYYDLTGSLTYLSVTALALILSDNPDARAVVVAVLVWIWALRLGSFLYARVKRDGRDGRFDAIKVDPVRFFMTWTLQGLWVTFTLACALAVITGGKREDFGVFAIIGLIVWVIGFTIEVVSDRQKSAFKADPNNAGRYITSGLWAWSRHPNYFGEITLWTGIAIMALPVLDGWRWVTLISPIFVIVLLTRISGIPLLEARAKMRWGYVPAFQTYKAKTPALILRPPRSS